MLADVPADARVLAEEIFGPVAPIATFATEERGARAPPTAPQYGLVAYLYTRDLARALRVAEGLETGMVGLNQGIVSNPAAPFGGRQAVGLRPRGRLRGDRRVPGDEVRRGGARSRCAAADALALAGSSAAGLLRRGRSAFARRRRA